MKRINGRRNHWWEMRDSASHQKIIDHYLKVGLLLKPLYASATVRIVANLRGLDEAY